MSDRSIENVEDRVIKMARTLVRRLEQRNVAYRTNGKLRLEVRKQLYLMAKRCVELDEMNDK